MFWKQLIVLNCFSEMSVISYLDITDGKHQPTLFSFSHQTERVLDFLNLVLSFVNCHNY